jgi:hypothetical protein
MPYIGNPIYQSAFVTDQFSGTGSATAFTMSVAPAGVSNVLVAVSGVLQDPSTYGVAGTTITFSTAPPPGTGNISCRYLGVPVTGITTTAYRTVTEFTATAGQTTFTPPSYTVGFISVYLNGVLLGSADYTASNGTTVVLTTGAAVGNLVTIESFQVSSVLNAIPNTAGAVSSSNIQTSPTLTTPTISTPTITGQATIPTINLTGGQITFPATAVPSADANTLDDYEEGTWSPAVSAGFTSPVYGNRRGTYTKIGRQVNFAIELAVTGGTRNGSLLNLSLPFTSDSASGSRAFGAYWTYADSSVNGSTTTNLPFLYISNGDSNVQFYNASGGSYVGTDLNSATPTFYICGSFVTG